MDLIDILVFTAIGLILGYVAWKYYQNAKLEEEKEKKRAELTIPPPKPEKKPVAPIQTKPSEPEKSHQKNPTISFGAAQKPIAFCLTRNYIVTLCFDKALRIFSRSSLSKRPAATKVPQRTRMGTTCASQPQSNVFCFVTPSNDAIIMFSISGREEQLECQQTRIVNLSKETPTNNPIDRVILRPDFLVVCSYASDTARIYSQAGELVATYPFKQGGMTDLAVSLKGTLMSAGCSTSEAKLVAIVRSKDQTSITGVAQVSYTTEHRSRIYAVTYSSDSQFLYTLSADGTIKKWKINIDFKAKDPTSEFTIEAPKEFMSYLAGDSASDDEAASAPAKGKKGTRKGKAVLSLADAIPNTSPYAKRFIAFAVNTTQTIMMLATSHTIYFLLLPRGLVLHTYKVSDPISSIEWLIPENQVVFYSARTNRLAYLDVV